MGLEASIVMTFRMPSPQASALLAKRKESLEHLAALDGLLMFAFDQDDPVPLQVEVHTVAEAKRLGLHEAEPWDLLLGGVHVARLRANVPVDLVSMATRINAAADEALSESEIYQIACYEVAGQLEKYAGDLLLAASIARPGAVEPTSLSCTVDGYSYLKRELGSTVFHGACRQAKRRAWPPIDDLSILECTEWLAGIEGFNDGVPVGEVGRAVAALSHLLGYEETPSSAGLMWCMVGLEALFTSGQEGLGRQLFDKTQVLLGSAEAFKKGFKGLYKYRSNFVHGALDIPVAYTPFDALEAFASLQNEMDAEQELAAAVLISTLQAMVIQGRHSIEFEWRLLPKVDLPAV